MKLLPLEVINYIYLFDNSCQVKYNNCIIELKYKQIYYQLINDMKYIKM